MQAAATRFVDKAFLWNAMGKPVSDTYRAAACGGCLILAREAGAKQNHLESVVGKLWHLESLIPAFIAIHIKNCCIGRLVPDTELHQAPLPRLSGN